MQPYNQSPKQTQKTQQISSKDQKYHVGQNLDIKDSVGKWINAQVLFVGNGTIYVHYSGWSAKYDQSLPIESNRILSQWERGKNIYVNNRIDVYHPVGGWLEARVLEVGGNNQKEKYWPVKVHFFNFHPKYDMTVNLHDKSQVAIIGSKSKAYGMGKKRSRAINSTKLSQMIKKLLQQRARNLQQNLQLKGLTVKRSTGDGNCLFRSISDQLYGNQQHHAQIRKICTDYITFEKDFFQDYVAQDIEQYINKMREDGTWGDDVQIQAISEIYARPIQIYVFGDKPIRTFHEDNEKNVEPIRLAYVGACHYDSIKPQTDLQKSIIKSQFGDFEQLFMATYRSDAMNNILRNRNLFSNSNKLQDTIQQQLLAENREQVKIQDQLVKALEVSQTEAILDQIQKSELRQLQNKYQQQKIQEQLKKIEQKQIQQAKKLSAASVNSPKSTSLPLHNNYPNQHQQQHQQTRPYWFDDLLAQGFTQKQIWFAIECKGFDPDAVQNFLLDNLCI